MTNGDNSKAGSAGLLYLYLSISVVLVIVCFLSGTSSTSIPRIWMSGAIVLGLLSGFTTGASEQTGAGSEFLKFVAGGIIVPLLGGVVPLTSAASPASTPAIHPLSVVGLFFLGYGTSAVAGIVLGIILREAKHVINMRA